MSIILEQLATGVFIPAAVAAVFLAAAWRPWKADDAPQRSFWGGALALSAAYVAVHLGVSGLPEAVPVNTLGWMVHIGVLAAVVGGLEALGYGKPLVRWPPRIGLAALALWLVLGFMVDNYWSGLEATLWLGALTLITLEITAVLDKLADRQPGPSAPLVMALIAGAGAAVLLLIGTARVGQMMGGLAAAAGVAVLFSWWHPTLRLSRGGATVFAVLFVSLLAFGYMSTADVPPVGELVQDPTSFAVLLVLTAPWMLWAARLDFIARLGRLKHALACAMLVALPLGGAAYFAANPAEEPVEEQQLDGVDYDELYGP